MAVSEDSDDMFEQEVYEQSYTEIRTLKARLPDKAVVLLAREVLRRLAEPGQKTSFEVKPYPTEQVDELALALICPDSKVAADLVRMQRAAGKTDEVIYLGYLAAAARTLGEWWTLDKVTFTQVTTGTGRIYAILRSLRPKLSDNVRPTSSKSALFAAVPDETHTLGIKMAADLLRDDGWGIDLQLGLDHDALVDYIATSNHQVVGLSAGGENSLESLATLIVAIRAWAPKTLILVSGHIVDEAREMVKLMGPDAMAAGLEDARSELERLWTEAISN